MEKHRSDSCKVKLETIISTWSAPKINRRCRKGYEDSLEKTYFRQFRLAQNLTQKGLALRSGVSLGSIKRFEASGEISLSSQLDIAMALGCLRDFESLFALPEAGAPDLFSDIRLQSKAKTLRR